MCLLAWNHSQNEENAVKSQIDAEACEKEDGQWRTKNVDEEDD